MASNYWLISLQYTEFINKPGIFFEIPDKHEKGL